MTSRGISVNSRHSSGRTAQYAKQERDGSMQPYYMNSRENYNQGRSDLKGQFNSGLSSKGFISQKPTNIGGTNLSSSKMGSSSLQYNHQRNSQYNNSKPSVTNPSVLSRSSYHRPVNNGHSTNSELNMMSNNSAVKRNYHQEPSSLKSSNIQTLGNGTQIISGTVRNDQKMSQQYPQTSNVYPNYPSFSNNRSTPNGGSRALNDKTNSYQNSNESNRHGFSQHKSGTQVAAKTDLFSSNAEEMLKQKNEYEQQMEQQRKAKRSQMGNSSSINSSNPWAPKAGYSQIPENKRREQSDLLNEQKYSNLTSTKEDQHTNNGAIQTKSRNINERVTSGKSGRDILEQLQQNSNDQKNSTIISKTIPTNTNIGTQNQSTSSSGYGGQRSIETKYSQIFGNGANTTHFTTKQSENQELGKYGATRESGLNNYAEKAQYSQVSTSSNDGLDDKKSERTKISSHKKFNSPTKKYEDITPRGIVGLRNLGNTCFMNSILQCLLNAPLFTDYFMQGNHKKEKNPKAKGLADAFNDLLQKVRSQTGEHSNSAENPSRFKSAIEKINPMFYGYDQHDAQELLKAALEGINDDLNRVTTKPKYKELNVDPKRSIQDNSNEWYEYMLGRDNSVVTDYFCGQLLNKIICSVCGNESLAFDNFWDLSLSFPSYKSRCTIEQMFEEFLKEETLDDLYKCEKCNKRQKSTKKFVIWKLPKILVIHLKRFSYGRYKREKINTSVQFPLENLDLSNYVKESGVKDPRYTLFGISHHSGGLGGGHYTAECMNLYNQKWYNFNDSWARESSISDGGGSSPYVLFYVKNSAFQQRTQL